MSNGSIIYEGRLAFMEVFTEDGTKAIRMPSADLPEIKEANDDPLA